MITLILCFFSLALGALLTRYVDHRRQQQAVKMVAADRLVYVWKSPTGTRRN